MLRIGMIGADNFHALAFSRLANLPPEEGGSGLPARALYSFICSSQKQPPHARGSWLCRRKSSSTQRMEGSSSA